MGHLNRRQRREQEKKLGRTRSHSRRALAGLSLIATTGLVSGFVSYVRPLGAYASETCLMPVTNSTTAAQINSAIDDAKGADCTALTLTSDSDVVIAVEETIRLSVVGESFGIIGDDEHQITLQADFIPGEGYISILSAMYFDPETPPALGEKGSFLIQDLVLEGLLMGELDDRRPTIGFATYTNGEGYGDIDVEIRNVSFRNFYADTTGFVALPYAVGAAVSVTAEEASVTIHDSYFLDNETIVNLEMLMAQEGVGVAAGAIAIVGRDSTTLTINNSIFDGNTGENIAAGAAASVSLLGSSYLTVQDSVFEYNGGMETLEDNGMETYGAGAILSGTVRGLDWGNSYATVTGNRFESNSAFGAGALSLLGDDVLVNLEENYFGDNAAPVNDGRSFANVPTAGAVGVHSRTVEFTSLRDSFQDNSSFLGGAIGIYSYGDGGVNTGSVDISYGEFDGNYSVSGGAVNIVLASYEGIQETIPTLDVDVSHSEFSYNEGVFMGGAMTLKGAGLLDLYVDDTSFYSNTATIMRYAGGAIFVDTLVSYVEIRNSDFTLNSSGAGGAIAGFTTGRWEIEDTAFSENSATDGGAIALELENYEGAGASYLSVEISGSTFTENSATEEGGALSLARSDDGDLYAQVSSSFFSNNDADYGGAIYVNSNPHDNDGNSILGVIGSSFSENSAVVRGHALDVLGTSAGVRNSTLFNNVGLDGTGTQIHVYAEPFHAQYLYVQSSTVWSDVEGPLSGLTASQGVYNSFEVIIENSVIANSFGAESVLLNTGGHASAMDFALNHSFVSGVLEDDVEITDLDVFGVGNISGTDPGLAETLVTESDETTHLPVLIPLAGSPLINAGDPEFLGFGEGVPLEDQRGFDRIFDERLDIGAVEVQELSVQEVNRVTPPGYTGPIGLDVQPTSPANTTAIATGRNLGTVTEVTINGVATTFEIVGNEIRFAVPNLDAGTYRVGFLVPSNNVLLTSSLLVTAEAKPDKIVNAGSFKGYVAIYAKGYEGSRLSAKVGEDWIIVDSLDANYVRIVEPTRWLNHAIRVQIFIDRVFVRAIDIVTR